MTRLDRAVTAIRRWVEDRLPWYDRATEERQIRRTEAIRQRSIRARIRVEEQLNSYRRIRL